MPSVARTGRQVSVAGPGIFSISSSETTLCGRRGSPSIVPQTSRATPPAEAGASGEGRQELLPDIGDHRGRDADEDGGPWRPGPPPGVHSDLPGQAVALAPVAGRARGDDVLPDRLATAAA